MRQWLVAFALLVPLPASADTLSGTRGEIRDRGHTIELRLHPGHAVLVVRRTFENAGNKHDQAILDIDSMPSGAVATGLRTLGTSNGKPTWFDGELLDAEVAAARYKYFTGIGGYYPKDPALLSWRTADYLKLQVFPIDPKGQKTIEYTLEVPTTYDSGRYTIELPAMGTASFAPSLTTRSNDPKDTLFVDGISIKNGDARRLAGSMSFSIAPQNLPKLGGRFASVGFAKGRALLHAAIEVAPKLSEVPKDAYVAVLIDASRSVAAADRDAQLAATRAYLSHFPDAHVALLPFDRQVRPLHDSFVTQKQALDALATAKLTPRNGSDFDLALTEAVARLDQAPPAAARRILLLTDLRTRSTLIPSNVRALDFKKSLVHVSTVRSGEASLSRDDADGWADVPRATGGVLWRASAGSNAPASRTVFEEWARPLRVDRLAVTGVGLGDVLELPDSLAEGEGLDRLKLNSFPTPSIELRGELWSTKITTLLETNASEERLWSALVFGSDVRDELTDKEMFALAVRGHAVSPMTSFLAIEPGVRPSTEGLEDSMGFGSGSGSLAGAWRTKKVQLMMSDTFDYAKFWRDKLSPIAAKCGGGALYARIETTLDEIVAIDIRPHTPNEALRTCVTNAAWELELPENFTGAWNKWAVDVPAP
jgi:hypothetical protein